MKHFFFQKLQPTLQILIKIFIEGMSPSLTATFLPPVLVARANVYIYLSQVHIRRWEFWHWSCLFLWWFANFYSKFMVICIHDKGKSFEIHSIYCIHGKRKNPEQGKLSMFSANLLWEPFWSQLRKLQGIGHVVNFPFTNTRTLRLCQFVIFKLTNIFLIKLYTCEKQMLRLC